MAEEAMAADPAATEILVGLDARRVSSASLRGIFRLLFDYAQQSPDPSTHNAALLEPHHNVTTIPTSVVACNQFPQGISPLPELLQNRDVKLAHMQHAETGAIYRAAKRGLATRDAVMYCLWAPCCPCARGIIDCGIHTLVTYGPMMRKTPERWLVEVLRGIELVKQAGVVYREFDEPLGGDIPHLFDGKIWHP